MNDGVSTQMTGADLLVETLKAQQVEYIFCSPIGACGPIWESLARRETAAEHGLPKYINCRHELLAVGLAAGFFKATGRPQICLLPTGLGVLNASIGLHDALQERIAMTVITPDTRSYGLDPSCDPGPEWPFLLTDLGGPVRDSEPVVKWAHTSSITLDLVANLQRAMYFAGSVPRGPTLLSVPLDVLMGSAPSSLPHRLEPSATRASDAAIEQAAAILSESRNPVILACHAGRSPDDRRALTRLAELLGAPVFEPLSPSVCNIQRDHPLHGRGTPPPDLLAQADCVLVAGSNAPWHPAQMNPPPPCKIVLLDEDPLRPRAPFWGYRTDLCIAGDIGLNLNALCRRLEGITINAAPSRMARWRDFNRASKRQALADARAAAERAAGIHAAHLFDALRQLLPEGATILDEIICQHGYMLDVLFQGATFDQIRGYGGALGQGIAQALGVRLARPDRLVVSLVGDGAFNYSPIAAYFGMAQQYHVPILVIVCNNGGYQSQKWLTQAYFPDGAAVRGNNIMGSVIEPDIDYSALAAPFGGFGRRVTQISELEDAIRCALDAIRNGRFAVLDVRVTP